VGLALSSSELVLMTDDDCEVAANWVEAMVAPFLEHPHVGLVFCDVVAGPHDPAAGFIPVSVAASSLLVTNLADWRTNGGANIGIGAGMAVRRSVAVAVGGFNPDFGSGSRFRSGNDLEFCLQLLAAGAQVFRTTATNVIHHGFRTHAQSRQLLRNNLFGAGAVYGQLLRQGHWLGLRCWLVAFTMLVLRPALAYLARMQPPRVLGRAQSLLRGLVLGLLARPVLRGAGLRGVVPTTWTRAQPVRPEGRASLSL
jgi:GT2 family glycosyltransferase